jgi:hypothetical protein
MQGLKLETTSFWSINVTLATKLCCHFVNLTRAQLYIGFFCVILLVYYGHFSNFHLFWGGPRPCLATPVSATVCVVGPFLLVFAYCSQIMWANPTTQHSTVVEIWRLPLCDSGALAHCFSLALPGLPNKWYQSCGSAWWWSGSGSWY